MRQLSMRSRPRFCDRSKSEEECGIRVIKRLETHTLRDGTQDWFREHFGFRDGVAQPSLEIANARERNEDASGISGATDEGNTVAAGEFLFGHLTEYGKKAEGGGSDAFAQNGSFLVFRQLEQNVLGFWKDIRDKAKEARIDPILLATKMVGTSAQRRAARAGTPGVDRGARDIRCVRLRLHRSAGTGLPIFVACPAI